MAKIYDVHSVIVSASNPNFDAHCYTEVYGSKYGCSIVINGTSVDIGPSSSLFINIRSVSGGYGCYLLGSNKDVFNGSEDHL